MSRNNLLSSLSPSPGSGVFRVGRPFAGWLRLLCARNRSVGFGDLQTRRYPPVSLEQTRQDREHTTPECTSKISTLWYGTRRVAVAGRYSTPPTDLEQCLTVYWCPSRRPTNRLSLFGRSPYAYPLPTPPWNP